MAIPKLLDQMRRSVRDDFDTISEAQYEINNSDIALNSCAVPVVNSTLELSDDDIVINSAAIHLSNSELQMTDSNVSRIIYDVEGNNIPVHTIGHYYDGTNAIINFLYDDANDYKRPILTNVGEPLNPHDVATKNYVDNAAPTIQNASTSQYGITKLSTSTSSTSTVLAATPSAVKSAYDLANAAMPKTGGTYTGAIQNNVVTELSSTAGYYRPIRVSTSEPTASDGNVGDIWIVYSE